MACGRGILSSIFNNNSSSDEVGREFLENGSLLLEDLIAFSNGRYNIPIRRFSVKEICQATNGFCSNRIGSAHRIYEGSFEERLIYIKKHHIQSEAIRDIAMMSVMSSHKNVLKVLGCCLDFKIPVSVCEYVAGSILLSSLLHGTERVVNVEEQINGYSSLTWKGRLKIASEIANAVVYMHTAFPTPIIHRDLKPANIIIDQCRVAKLMDFSLSISIPPGETQVETNRITGTFGYMAPDYALNGIVTEKSDVYSFGVVLLVLLTGKRPYKKEVSEESEEIHIYLHDCVKDYADKNQLKNVVDPRILQHGEGGGIEQDQQFQAFAALALRCVQENKEDRPEMIDVAKEVRRMYKSSCQP